MNFYIKVILQQKGFDSYIVQKIINFKQNQIEYKAKQKHKLLLLPILNYIKNHNFDNNNTKISLFYQNLKITNLLRIFKDGFEYVHIHIYDIFMKPVLIDHNYVIKKYSYFKTNQLIYYMNYYYKKYNMYSQNIFKYYIEKLLILNNINELQSLLIINNIFNNNN